MRRVELITGLLPDEEARCWAASRALAGGAEVHSAVLIKAARKWRFIVRDEAGRHFAVVCQAVTVRSNTRAARELFRAKARRGIRSSAFCTCGGDVLSGQHLPGCVRVPMRLRKPIRFARPDDWGFFQSAVVMRRQGASLDYIRAERSRQRAWLMMA